MSVSLEASSSRKRRRKKRRGQTHGEGGGACRKVTSPVSQLPTMWLPRFSFCPLRSAGGRVGSVRARRPGSVREGQTSTAMPFGPAPNCSDSVGNNSKMFLLSQLVVEFKSAPNALRASRSKQRESRIPQSARRQRGHAEGVPDGRTPSNDMTPLAPGTGPHEGRPAARLVQRFCASV